MTTSRLLATVKRYRQQLLNEEAQAEHSLNSAYRRALEAIAPTLEKLYDQMVDKMASGEQIPPGWLYEAQRIENIKKLIVSEFTNYGAISQAETLRLQRMAVELGQEAAHALLQSTVPVGISYSFGVPSEHAIADLIGATQAGSPLADLFNGFGAEAAKNVSDALIRGVTLGNNPRVVARDVQQALGISRARALTISRNEMLRCYKNANTETYRANSDVVEQWRWACDKSVRTCFPKGTMVETRRGNVPIERVQIGDEVLTNKGRYKRVYDTLQRPYSGEMVTVRSGDRSVVATSNHPFLIERQGKLDWIEAGNIRLSDHAVCKSDGSSQVVNHGSRDIAIEWDIRDTNNTIPPALQESGFASVGLLDSCGAMPINPIDLKRGVAVWQKEVDGISPSFYNMFLDVFNPQRFQAEAGIPFWSSFASMPTIALDRTKLPANGLGGRCPELVAAIGACVDGWRASAFLRTVLPIRSFLAKDFTAPFARYIDGLKELAILRAIDGVFFAEDNSKFFFANNASFGCIAMNVKAFSCAVLSRSLSLSTKHFAAPLTNQIKRWGGNIARTCMRLSMLMDNIAIIGAESPVSFALPCFGNDKLFAAYLAGQFDLSGSVFQSPRFTAFRTAVGVFLPFDIADIYPSIFSANRANTLDIPPISFNVKFFHSSIISQHDTHVHNKTTVYNIEVEDDHSYVANGFAVHNCAACIAMDGTLHDLSEDLESHVQCRCAPVPVTKSWDEILSPLGIDSSNIEDTRPQIQSGSDWFDEQDTSTQRAILGNAKYNAWANGDFKLSDIVGHDHDADWGHSIYEKPLKDLVKA